LVNPGSGQKLGIGDWGLGIHFGFQIADWGFDCGLKDWGLKRIWNRQEVEGLA
jgi:hypothetical protein